MKPRSEGTRGAIRKGADPSSAKGKSEADPAFPWLSQPPMNPEKTTEVRSHILRNVSLPGWNEHIAGRWSYRQLVADPLWHHGWISFDALTYNPSDGGIYCGLNSLDGDLLYRFDPEGGAFTGLNTQRWTDSFDSKIHRSLLLNPLDNCFYFATSLLHDIDQQTEAPGGKLVRYDWKKNTYEVLGIPIPQLYVQSIAMDARRGILYGFTYPAELLFRHDLSTGKTRTLGYIGNACFLAQPHNAVVDRDGWLWGTCAETRAWDEIPGLSPIRLFKYHPDEDRFVWFAHGLARRTDREQISNHPDNDQKMPDMAESRHKEDYGFCDSMVYDGGHYIYAGSTAGVLSRINIASGAVEKVATVMASGRLPALAFSTDGTLFGGGGMRGKTALLRYDPQTAKVDVWSGLYDPENGEVPARIHDICLTADGTIFFAENDNHHRSSYLWSANLT